MRPTRAAFGSRWKRAPRAAGSLSPCSCKGLEGAAHFLRRAFHPANAAQAGSQQQQQQQQRTRGIFMGEVHASNSLSSFKLAAPAQKDLGAVNNSAWLRDFHFTGPCSPIPQGPAGAAWLCRASPRLRPTPWGLCTLLPSPPPCPSLHAQPRPPASLLHLPLLSACLFFPPSPCSLSGGLPLLPRLSLPSSILSAFLSLPPLFIGSALQQRRQSHCAPCSLSSGWTAAERSP